MSPSRPTNLMSSSSSLLLSKASYNVIRAFSTEDNVPQCISYINQELCSLGLSSSCIEAKSPGGALLCAVPVLNTIYELLQIHRHSLASLEEMEREQLKKSSTLEHMHMNNSRLKDQLELSIREKCGLHETERQLQLKVKTLQSFLKSEKEEVQKLQSIISSRASQYSHDAKRKEREAVKLKERLGQLLVDRRDKRLAMDVLNCLAPSDGRRRHWRTAKVAASHETDMYKSLLGDYEATQRSLMLEKAELHQLLQQMKKEMMVITSPRQSSATAEHTRLQADCDVEERTGDSSAETLDRSCEQAKQQLTNSIRQQWRKLRKHMEKLDRRASQVDPHGELIPRESHESEMDRMRCEVQQCKEFIQAQQQLLQQQLNTSFDDETASLLNDCYSLEEKERLKEEWTLFEEQKGNFERERKNFTEAAIRLGREKKAFEEERACWLKSHFLNMTPLSECRCSTLSNCQRASSIRSEPEVRRRSSTKAEVMKSSPSAPWSPVTPQSPAALPSTAELSGTCHRIPNSSWSINSTCGRRQRWSSTEDGAESLQTRSRRLQGGDSSVWFLGEDENISQ